MNGGEMKFEELLIPGRELRRVAPGIVSVLPASAHAQYDRYARLYHLLVGTKAYNRAVWGNLPSDYESFAAAALESSDTGWHLDAGGGSLLFTAELYCKTVRPVVVLDRSLRMLTIARERLVARLGAVPEHIILLQGDVLDLPFRRAVLASIVSLHVLHHIDDASAMLEHFNRSLRRDGHLFLTSIVRTNRLLANLYLSLLHHAGEFVKARTEAEVRRVISSSVARPMMFRTKGSLVYAATCCYEDS